MRVSARRERCPCCPVVRRSLHTFSLFGHDGLQGDPNGMCRLDNGRQQLPQCRCDGFVIEVMHLIAMASPDSGELARRFGDRPDPLIYRGQDTRGRRGCRDSLLEPGNGLRCGRGGYFRGFGHPWLLTLSC